MKAKRCSCGDKPRIEKCDYGFYSIACDNCFDPTPQESWQGYDTRGSFTGGSEEEIVELWNDYQEDQE